MAVTKIPLPANSFIAKSFPIIDYADCFHSTCSVEQTISLNDCVRFFFYQWPKWAQMLMKIRNVLMWPFGLATGKSDWKKKNVIPLITISKGRKIAFFDVVEYNDEEVLLSITDKHLDACLSVLLKKPEDHYEISLSTTVMYNNTLGKVYFFFIKPFHKLIMRTLLYRLVNYITLYK
jgi:hypothetical protein